MPGITIARLGVEQEKYNVVSLRTCSGRLRHDVTCDGNNRPSAHLAPVSATPIRACQEHNYSAPTCACL